MDPFCRGAAATAQTGGGARAGGHGGRGPGVDTRVGWRLRNDFVTAPAHPGREDSVQNRRRAQRRRHHGCQPVGHRRHRRAWPRSSRRVVTVAVGGGPRPGRAGRRPGVQARRRRHAGRRGPAGARLRRRRHDRLRQREPDRSADAPAPELTRLLRRRHPRRRRLPAGQRGRRRLRLRRRHLRGLRRRPAAAGPDRGHGDDAGRQGLLAGRARWRRVRLRRRPVLRLHGRHARSTSRSSA